MKKAPLHVCNIISITGIISLRLKSQNIFRYKTWNDTTSQTGFSPFGNVPNPHLFSTQRTFCGAPPLCAANGNFCWRRMKNSTLQLDVNWISLKTLVRVKGPFSPLFHLFFSFYLPIIQLIRQVSCGVQRRIFTKLNNQFLPLNENRWHDLSSSRLMRLSLQLGAQRTFSRRLKHFCSTHRHFESFSLEFLFYSFLYRTADCIWR